MPAPDALFEVATARLSDQISNIDAIDAKVATCFGFGAAVLPVFGAFFVLADPTGVAMALYCAAVLVYCVLMYVTTGAYRIKGWSFNPDLPTLARHSADREENEVKTWVASECIRSIDDNGPLLKQKARRAGWALALLALDALLLAAAAVATGLSS